MTQINIVYVSKNGQTAKIAEFIRRRCEEAGCRARLTYLSKVSSKSEMVLSGDTHVILGGPVYAGRFSNQLKHWVRHDRSLLANKKTAYFSVSLNAAEPRENARQTDIRLLRKLIDATGSVPDCIASFKGSLAFPRYNLLVRRIMLRISRSVSGPTDLTLTPELTDWQEIKDFTTDFVLDQGNPIYRTQNAIAENKVFDREMPRFDLTWCYELPVVGSVRPMAEILKSVPLRDMKAANIFGRIRSLGRGPGNPLTLDFATASENFGVIPLQDEAGNGVYGGLVGKFWQLGFGIRKMQADQFRGFLEPGYTKVITGFQLIQGKAQAGPRFRVEMRIFSTDKAARIKFRFFWLALGLGIKIYMRSVANAVRRAIEAREKPQLNLAPISSMLP